MGAEVRVNGFPLEHIAAVAGVTDSTIWRSGGWSGDYQASCTFAADRGFAAPWFRRGSVFEVVENGVRTWGGPMAEPQAGEVWTLNAYGFGSAASDYPALVKPTTDPATPSGTPDDAITYAGTLSPPFPIKRYATLALGSASLDPGEVRFIDDILNVTAAASGKRWRVDSFGEITSVSDPTSPSWVLSPGAGYMGTADEEWVSALAGIFVTTADASGKPTAWAVTTVNDRPAEDWFGGASTRTVDLTQLGVLSESSARSRLTTRLGLVGARMGYTNSLDLTQTNLSRMGWGNGSPLNVRAGDMLRIPDVWDTRSNPTIGSSIDLVLGEVTRIHAEERAVVKPVGFVARDFAGALAAAQPPQVKEEAA